MSRASLLSVVSGALVLLSAPLQVGAEDATRNGIDGRKLQVSRFPQLHNADSKPDDPDDLKVDTTKETVWRYFNAAHCECGKQDLGVETKVGFDLKFDSGRVLDTTVDILVGKQCELALQVAECEQLTLASPLLIDSLATTPQTVKLPVDRVMRLAESEVCMPAKAGDGFAGDRIVYLMVDSPTDGSYNYFEPVTFNVDTKPPTGLTNLKATAGESAVTLNWEIPQGGGADFYRFQALCAKVEPDGTVSPGVADAPNRPEAAYQTPRDLCDAAVDFPILPSEGAAPTTPDAGVPDAGTSVDAGTDAGAMTDASTLRRAVSETNLPAQLRQLDSTFLCGETGKEGQRTMRINGLTNGAEYFVMLLAIDKAGNPTPYYLTKTLKPVEVTDFWEDLHERGGETEGGFCLLAETYGDGSGPTQALRAFRDETLASTAIGRWLTAVYYDRVAGLGEYVKGSLALRIITGVLLAPVVALALAWHYLTLPGLVVLLAALVWWRRRRKRARPAARIARLAPAAAATALALVAINGSAHAQGFAPYWDDELAGHELSEEKPQWHMGIKLGPYTPDIDDQFREQHGGSGTGPFEQMFEGGMWMPVLEVDWLVLNNRIGQLGIGGSVGFAGDGAKAFARNTSPSDADRHRSDDENSFRMLPTALTAVYRATQLDDNWGIPLVPYLRGGVSYYVWWALAPSGNLARVFPPGCTPGAEGCKANTAAGASLGLQGSLGVAIRAERIDAESARSMRDSGIEHAGFYAEVQKAWVDGFGNEKKLALGALTWFAGIDFEF